MKRDGHAVTAVVQEAPLALATIDPVSTGAMVDRAVPWLGLWSVSVEDVTVMEQDGQDTVQRET